MKLMEEEKLQRSIEDVLRPSRLRRAHGKSEGPVAVAEDGNDSTVPGVGVDVQIL